MTGGAAGIGYTTAEAYAARGAKVIIVDIDGAKLAAATAKLGVQGIQADLSVESDVKRLIDQVIAEHGRIDILVNLAAIYPFAMIEDETFEGFKRMLAVNLDSVFLCCQGVLPHMRERGYGRIVNTASGTFFNGQPGLSSYVASKGGTIGFTRVLAKEVGKDGITVNVIMPGLIATQHVLDMFGDTEEAEAATTAFFQDAIDHQSIKRRGEPEDLAHGILFLTDERSSFISGQTLQVDGGWSFT